MTTDNPHIFPFCRQSQIVGLEEAIAIVDGTPFLVSDGDNFASIIKTSLRRRIAELTEEAA
jgi:hypothetical protein